MLKMQFGNHEIYRTAGMEQCLENGRLGVMIFHDLEDRRPESLARTPGTEAERISEGWAEITTHPKKHIRSRCLLTVSQSIFGLAPYFKSRRISFTRVSDDFWDIGRWCGLRQIHQIRLRIGTETPVGGVFGAVGDRDGRSVRTNNVAARANSKHPTN